VNLPQIKVENKLRHMIENTVDRSMTISPVPIIKRLKRSKFAKLIHGFTDEQIKHLVYCLVYDSELKEAIDCYTKAGGARVQLAAMLFELQDRDIILNK